MKVSFSVQGRNHRICENVWEVYVASSGLQFSHLWIGNKGEKVIQTLRESYRGTWVQEMDYL
jgi:hypothetical protein